MGVSNSFHLIGVCYGDSKITQTKKGNMIARFILAVDNKTYIPIVTYGLEAERATYKCRNGNKIAVSGYVRTTQKVNGKTGQLEISMWFISRGQIMIIALPKKKVLNELKPKELSDIYCPEEHPTPKVKEVKQ